MRTDSSLPDRFTCALLSVLLVTSLVMSLLTFSLSSNPISASPSPGGWWDNDWPFRKSITIDHTEVDDNLDNFPVLISITDSDLAPKAMENGDDIAFVDNGGIKLEHEIEDFDHSTGKLVAWVRIPFLSSSENTVIHMYYGNSEASNQENVEGVWDDNYIAVWHMKDNTTSTVEDSTSNSNDGTKASANNPNEVDGKIAKAQDFSSDYIDVTGLTSTSKTYTISLWFKWTTQPDSSYFIDIETGRLIFVVRRAINNISYYDGSWKSFVEAPTDTWKYVTLVVNNSSGQGELFLDENSQGTDSYTGKDIGDNVTLGSRYSKDQNYFDGVIDEVRISNVARSAGWISTEYNNQSSPSTFCSVGSEESSPGLRKPTLISPENGAIIYDNTPTFVWGAGANATSHRLVIDNSSDFSDGDNIYDNSNLGASDTTCTIENELPADNYWWKVIAENATAENSSLIRTFELLTYPSWWGENWQYRKEIEIDHTKVDSDLNDFPLLINVSDSDLSKAQADGDDIAFVNDNNLNQLDHEIESFDGENLVAWVRIPSLSSTENTKIYLYYGNSGASNQENIEAVWDSNYLMVQHLKEKTGTHYDSTFYNNDGTPGNGVTQDASSKINGADSFDGADDYIDCENDSSLDITGAMTIEAWVKLDTIGNWRPMVSKGESNDFTTHNYILTTTTANKVRLKGTFGSLDTTDVVSAGIWYYMVGVADGTNIKIYINGALSESGPQDSAPTANDNRCFIGAFDLTADPGKYFDGIIDEVRISDTTRSADWISTSYNNQNNPSAFYNVGSEEMFAYPEEPVISEESPENGSIGVELNPTLQARITDYQGNTVNWWIMENTTGSWSVIENGTLPTGSGIISATPTTMTSYETTYWWSVNAIDPLGSNTWENKIFSFTTKSAPAPWWNTSWLYRKKIIIDSGKVDSDLTNFPVLIDVTDSALASHAQDNGDDIVFTDSSGTKLNHEIELYDNNTDHLIAWVRADLSSTENTILYMYYGNAGASNQENIEGVWDDNYVMVQHLDEKIGTHYDSTSYNNDGTPGNGVTQDASGKINGADSFDGTDDYIDCENDSSLDITDFLTLEAWVKHETGNQGYIIIRNDENDVRQYGVLDGPTTHNAIVFFCTVGQFYWENTEVDDDTWHHVAVTVDYPNVELSVDGVSEGVQTLTSHITSVDTSVWIGKRKPNNLQFRGLIDEVRISNVARSSGWISTEYNNENSPSTFYSVGSEETIPEEPIISDENPADGATEVLLTLSELSFTLTDCQGDNISYTVTSPELISSPENGTVSSGTTVDIPVTGSLAYDTLYTWYVHVTDVTHGADRTFTFTTRLENYPPSLSNPSPENGSTGIRLNPTLSIDVNHIDNHPMDIVFETDASGTWEEIKTYTGVLDGTYTATPTNMKKYGTTYNWRVTATSTVNTLSTTKTYSFTTLTVASFTQDIGDYYCAGAGYVGQAADKDTFYVVWQQYDPNKMYVYEDKDIAYAEFNRNTGWVTVNAPITDPSSEENMGQYIPSWGYWGDEYHVCYYECPLDHSSHYVSMISSPTWSGFQSMKLKNEEFHVTDELGDGDARSTTYSFNNDQAWVLTQYNQDGVVAYWPWCEDFGWGERKYVSTAHGSGPTLLPVDRSTYYIYYINIQTPRTIRYVKSTDGGKTWGSEQICSGVENSSGNTLRPSFARYGDNFYMITGDSNFDVVCYHSTDGENWENKQVIFSPSSYTIPQGCMLSQSALLWTASDMDKWDSWALGTGDQIGGVFEIPEMIANPGKPTDPYPSNGATIVQWENTIHLKVTVHGDETYDVAFYWENGTFIGEDKLLKEGDTASVEVTGLVDNETYEWYTIARGTTYNYWGGEPDTTSDENRSDTWDFTINIIPQKIFLSNPSPEDNGTRVSLNPTLSIDISHIDNHPMDIVFETDASGTWEEIKTYTEVLDGTYTATPTNMNKRDTVYNWRVTATDATDENIKTSRTYIFEMVYYKGDRVTELGTSFCGKVGYIRPIKGKGNFVASWMSSSPPGEWALYNIDNGWVKTHQQLYNSGYSGHFFWGYWDNLYHTGDGSSDYPYHFELVDSPTWEGFRSKDRYVDYYSVGLGSLNCGVVRPSTYTFSENSAWIISDDEENGGWVIKYFPWNKSSGWENGVPVWETWSSTHLYSPVLLQFNRNTWYLYYVHDWDGTRNIRYVKTTNAGETWENEQTCPELSPTGYSRPSFARYGNNFYIFLEDPNNDAVVYSSTNMENWENKIMVYTPSSYYCHHGCLLHQEALISTVGDAANYDDEQYGVITVVPEMLAYPGKPSDSFPENGAILPLGTTSTNLQVTVHGDQVYDVAFYWEDGIFIGEDKLLEENDKASVSVSGLSDNTTYRWYAIARGTTGDYSGCEPLTTSDENRTNTYSFSVSPPEKPIISNESPENESIGVGLNPTLQADIIDYQENVVDWWIKENSTGTWQTVDNGTLPTGNGTISASPTAMTSYETAYWWSVTATDGIHWTSENYCFTTKVAPTHGPWWDVDWQYRKMITIDHTKVDDNLTDFPVLIDITDNDLKSHARFDGADIAFADYDGNRLNHEIEFYNGNTGELVAWVKVPELSSTENTNIYLYYGNSEAENLENPSDVWDSNYMMVQHLPHNWIPYENNPFWIHLWHSVFKVGDTYHAYYPTDGAAINHATSPDGKNWTDDTANNPVLTRSDNGWDSTYIGVPWTWYENGTWYMLYYGPGTKTGLATSSDGINWTKYPNNESPEPVIEAAEPWAVMKVDNTYYEYYVVNNYMGNRVVCLATSTDLINWTKDPRNPIFSVGVSEPNANGQYNSDAFKYGSYYYILIPHYTSGSDYAQIELYRDTSPTFYPESREYLGAVKPVAHSGWDSHDQDTPAVLTDDVYRNSFDASGGELWVYFNGEAGPRQQGLLICPSIPQALKGVMRDSTIYGNHGAGDGVGGPVPEFCLIGGGYNFDGLDEYMFVSDSSSLDIDNEMTLDVWVKLDTELSAQPNSYPGIISKRDNSLETGYGIWFETAENELIAYIGSGTAHTVSVDVGGYDWTDWHHITVTYDGTMNIYVDNNLENSELIGEAIGVNSVDLWIGDLVDNTGNVIDGSIDEVRISDVARSAEWISTSYNNQINPSAFYDVLSEETPEAPIISDEDPANGAENIPVTLSQLSFKLTDLQGDNMDYTVETSPNIGSGSDNDVSDGTYSVGVSGLAFNTTYTWTVYATDGIHWTEKTFSFTTAPGWPIISDESPKDGSTGIDLNPILQATITDYENDLVKWWIKENSSGMWVTVDNGTLPTGSGTISASPTTMTEYETTYWWSVNAIDPYGSNTWENKIFSFTTKSTPALWWDNDWWYRKTITIDHTKVDADLTGFPVLIDITDNDLATHAQADGDDIVFTDNSGIKLDHEIELYDNGHLVAWVSANLSSTENTILYMYYGNAGASNQENAEGVWDDNYVMVQHLEEISGTHYDSTSYSNDGSPNGGINQDATGKINGADEFDGSNDYINVSDDPSLDHASGEGFTYTGWIKSEYLSGYKAIIIHRDPGSDAVIGLWTSGIDLYCEVKNDGRTSTATGTAGVTLSLDTWYYVGLTRSSGGSVNLWLSGSSHSIGTCTGNITPSQDLDIGRHSTANDQYFDGVIDEVRISNIERGSGWILTSYNNQNNPSAFYTIGNEEIGVVPEEPMISEESPENGSINVELNPTLQAYITDYQGDPVDWWIKENSTGTWQTIDNGTLPTGIGTISATPTTMTSYMTTYWWSVSATDGTHWTSENYCFTTKVAPGPWWGIGWQYRKMITIDHTKVDDNLTNFPVLISFTSDSDLASHAQFDGDDIAFADYNGNRLNHEIEFYNGNTGELVAWVNIPELSSTEDTKIYLYYGNGEAENQENSSGVWDSNYVMVQHLPHNWIPYSGNPLTGVGQWHSVFKVGDTYHAYYHGPNQINHATSPDGKNWTDDTANNPVLPPSASGWDSVIGVPWAWYENGTWYMLYYGYSGTNAIGLATSPDGINWTKYPDNDSPTPVITDAEPWGVMKVDNMYYEYYVVNNYMGNRVVCLATSTDLVNWTKDNRNPIFSVGVSEPDANGQMNSDAFKYGSYYYILVSHYTSGSDYAQIELYRDTNPTFYPESREYLGAIKPVAHSGWDSHDQDTPAVLTDDVYRDSFDASGGELWVYYDGEAGGTRREGLLICPSIPQALKGAMRDSTTYRNHGAGDGVGGPVPEFCLIGGGYNFDGIDEYIFVPDNSSLDIDNEMTMDVWVKLDTQLSAQPNSYLGIISKRNNSSETGYGIWFNTTDNELIAYIGSGTAHTVSVDVGGYDWTDWHHITVTYDGTMNIYVDNNLENSELIGGGIGTNNENLWIGDLVDNTGNVIDGNIDEVRISDVARSAEWIGASFNNENSPSTFYSTGSEENQPVITRGVDVSILPSENSGVSGETLTYTVTVRNTGNVPDSYSLENSDNLGWVLSLDNDLLTIPASENRTTMLRVIVPTYVQGCTRDNVTVTATSVENEDVSDIASCIAHVKIVRGVEVSISPSENGAEPCNWLEYTVTVMNTGNVADNFDLSWVDTESWDNIWLEDNALWVDRCDNENSTTLHVHIPWCAEGCTWDNITVTATSRENTDIKDNDTCRAHVDIVRGIKVSISPSYQTAGPCNWLEYTVTVTNTGNVDDVYSLSVTDNLSWDNIWLEDNSLSVPRCGGENTTTLHVHIPENAEMCTEDNVTVTATSQSDNEVSDNDSCTAHVAGVYNVDKGIWYTTIQAAVNDADSGNMITVHPGTYNESVIVTKDNLTIIGLSGSRPIIDPPDGQRCFTVNANGVTIEGFEMTGVLNATDGALVFEGSNNIFRNNIIHGITLSGNGGAICCWDYNSGSDNNLIENNIIYNANVDGILMGACTLTAVNTGNKYIGNRVENCGTWHPGLEVVNGVDFTIENNIVIGTVQYYGIFHYAWNNVVQGGHVISGNEVTGYYMGIEIMADTNGGNPQGLPSVPSVTITGLMIMGNEVYLNQYHGIDLRPIPNAGSAIIGNSIVSYNRSYNHAYDGILLRAYSDNNIVSNNEVWGDNRTGIRVNGNNNLIENNNAENNGHGIWIGGDNNTVRRNTIRGNTTPSGSGIHLDAGTSGNVIHYNNIMGNSTYGVFNASANVVDATCNWWGHENGPYHPTTNPLGLGDNVSDNVDYDPWLRAPVGSVWISVSPSYQSGGRGSTLYYTVTVQNTDNVSRTYDLIAEDNAGWNPTLDNYSLEVPPCENRTTTLRVTIPDNAENCTKDNVTVTATSKVDNTVSANNSCVAHVVVVRDVEVEITPSYQSGTPGENLTYDVWVTNTGSLANTYDLENSDIKSWTLSLSQGLVGPLAPGDNAKVTLTVTIDNDAPYCTKDNITVTATSQTDNTVSDSDSCIAHAIPENVLTVSLVAGWNLIGFTGVSENDNLDNIFCDLEYYTDYYLYYWNPPGGPYGVDLGPDDIPEDNLGYWVWINQDTKVGTTGTPPENRDIHLVAGWNLVSFPVVNENTTIGSVFTGLTYYDNYYLYYWNPPGGPYGVDLGPDDIPEDNLGYWVWIDQNKTVTVP